MSYINAMYDPDQQTCQRRRIPGICFTSSFNRQQLHSFDYILINMQHSEINIRKIIQRKNPRLYKLLPGFIFGYIEKIIHQSELNNFLQRHSDKYDYAFVAEVLNEFGMETKIIGKENIVPAGGCIFAANHPLGGLDAMALGGAMGQVRKDIKVMVTDMLLNIDNLKDHFVGVNKIGKTSSQALLEIEKQYAIDQALVVFPAGLVSRKQFTGGYFSKSVIEDLSWKKSFISRAKKYQKNVVPVFIDGRNSNFFYNLSLWRKRFGIKTNMEMLYLVDEFYKQKNKTITLIFGKEIPFETFDRRLSDGEWAQKIKQHVYKMGKANAVLPFIA